MGKVSEFACPSCGHRWEVQLSHGMSHAVLENVLKEFPEDIRQRILIDTKNEQIPSFEFNYHPALCGYCRKVTAIPVVYLHGTKQTYTTACPDCRNSVVVLGEEAEAVCPNCGNAILSEQEKGRWD